MRSETYLASIELRDLIKSSDLYLDLLKKEKEMEEDELAISLAIIKEKKAEQYSFMLNHFKEDDPNLINARKELFIAKKNLEELEVVKNYLSAYQKVRLLLNEVNDILFKDMTINLCKTKN